MDSRVWDSIKISLPKEHVHTIDVGFVGDKKNVNIPSDKPAIYITHSLGTLWALKHHISDMDALIAINGFPYFPSFVDTRTLQTMQKRLARNPSIQMKSFWTRCGMKEDLQNELDQALNTDRLQDGLEWLINWDVREELSALSIPVLALGGDKDLILPLENMKQEWADFNSKIKDNGDHVLPLSAPKWCMSKIEEFLGEFELEG